MRVIQADLRDHQWKASFKDVRRANHREPIQQLWTDLFD